MAAYTKRKLQKIRGTLAIIFAADSRLGVFGDYEVRIFSCCSHPERLPRGEKSVGEAADLAIPVPEPSIEVVAHGDGSTNAV